MLNVKQLQEENTTVTSLKMVTDALGDVATSKIKSTRRSMQQNIQYFQEMFEVYRTVKILAQRASLLPTKKHGETFYQRNSKSKNGKTICLLLTSNQRFNGGLDTSICKYFIEHTKGVKADFLVIGSLGNEYLTSVSYPQPWKRLVFERDFPSLTEIRQLSQVVFNYSRILVFHTQFITVLNQSPTISDITSSDIEVKPQTIPTYYIVEPEIDKMLEFFESQILTSLFEAVFLEVELARTAARMIAMNQAGESANKILEVNKKDLLKVKKQQINLKILETYAAIIREERQL